MNGVIAGINMEIPIFSANMRRKSFQNAKINLDSKNRSLEKMKETIKTSLVTAFYTYTEGLNNLELLQNFLNVESELNEQTEISNESNDQLQFEERLTKFSDLARENYLPERFE